jgi:hypothetical protein
MKRNRDGGFDMALEREILVSERWHKYIRQ